MSKHSPAVLSRSIATLAAALAVTTLTATKARAATLYWDGTGTTANGWNAVASWSTAVGATTPDPAAVPGAADDANFSISTVTTAQTVNLNANQAAMGLIFLGTNTAATTLQGGGTNRTLNLGINGITVNSGAGAVTIGSTTANQNVALSLQGAQSWTNNATTALSIVNGVSLGVAGANTLSLAGTSTAANTISGVVGNGSGTLALSKSGTGLWVLSGANTFTGGTTVSAGTLRGTVAGAFGSNTTASAITLGGGTLELFNDTNTAFTNANTTVTANSTVTANRAASATTTTTHTLGTLSIGAQTLTATRGSNITGAGIGGVTFGATTLTGNATFAPGASATLTLGGVGGAFGLTQNGAGTTVLSGAGTYSGGTTVTAGILQLNNNTSAGTGTITYNSGSTGRVNINGGVTVANNFVIDSTTGTASVGFIQQTGSGRAVINGTITVNGAPTNGGTFLGGTAVGSELVLNGAINGGGASQREGRVIYAGGGSATGNLNVTNTALVGATNGLPQAWSLSLGGSGNATLDLNGFDQALAGIQAGNTTTNNTNNRGTVLLGGNILTLNGNISTISPTTSNVSHLISATAGGGLNVGSVNRSITLTDTLAGDDFVINGAAINGSGGITKDGAGTLALNGVTVAGPLTLNAGTLQTGTFNQIGNFAAGSLSLNTGTTLKMKIGATSDQVNVTSLNGLTASGTTLNITSLNGPLAVGTTDLINYSGTIQGGGLAGITLTGVGHATATLQDTGSAVRLNVTQATDTVIWTGATNTTWDNNGANANWKFQTSGTGTGFLDGDDVLFQDLAVPTSTTVNIGSVVMPSRLTVNNTAANSFTFTGAGINGPTGLTKNGDGTLVLRNSNSYTGATAINAGTLEVDLDSGTLNDAAGVGTSGVTVASGATLKLTRDDGDFTFNRSISGAGTVVVDPHSAAGAGPRTVTISGNNSGFTGIWKLSPTTSGSTNASFRTLNTSTNAVTLGSADIDVDTSAQLWIADNATLANDITITGTGFGETGGGTPVGLGALANGVYVGSGTALFSYAGVGAIRMGTNNTLAGNLVVDGNAKIAAFGQTGTISGNISSTSASDTLVFGGGTSSSTMILTGTNTYGKTWVNGGSGTSGVTHILQVGNNGNTGTLGSGEVILYGNSAANAELRFNRADGYTLAPSQNISGAAGVTGDLVRTKVIVNTTGTGLTLNGNTIDLSDGTNGGELRVAGNNGSNGINGSILNITGSSVVDTGLFYIGDQANMSGSVNQSDTSSVTVLTQLRIGHFATNTSSYNMTGGTLNFPAAAPATFPYGTGEQNGGMYIGVDGTGNFTHSGGTISTNFLVLDNRTNTDAGANMATGVDTYNLSGTGTLILKNAQGLISRNASVAVNLNGGTIQAATGISPALDSNKINIQSGGVTLDTNGAGSTFNLYGGLAGTGTVNLIGGGTLAMLDGTGATNTQAGGTMPGGSLGTASINIGSTSTLRPNRTGVDIWSGSISGSGAFIKAGNGTLILTGNSSSYTGTTTVSAGRLDLPANFAMGTVNVSDGATLAGEPALASLTLGTTTGTSVVFDPTTAGALNATSLTANGATALQFATVPTGAGPWTALNYTTKSGTGTFDVAGGAANYRSAVVSDTGTSITVDVTGTKALTWTGTGGATWNINTTQNWNDSTPAAEKFFAGDTVTFDDSSTANAVAVTAGVSPWKTTVSSNTTAYTLTSAASGAGIAGPGNLEKSGTSTLTLVGQNTYTGKTIISGGAVSIAAANSLGNGAVTNTIALSGGGRLNHTGSTAIDFGVTRSIAVGTGGGILAHNNGTAATLSIPGNISGTGDLTFTSAAAGAGTFVLSGDNSGYSGNISVGTTSTGLTVLRLASQSAVPAGGSITLNYPASGANQNAVTLDLSNGVSLPSSIGIAMTSFLTASPGNLSLRTQVTSSGLSEINGPVTLTGNGGSLVQFVPSSGTLTINGDINEATPGSFGTGASLGQVLFRSGGNTVINGKINLPTAMFVRVDDNGTTTVNSTGNVWAATDVRSNSTLRLGVTNALPAGATLNIGQASDNSPTVFEMNGFDQTVNGLTSIASTSGSNNRRVTNSSTTLSTLTLDSSVDRTFGNATGNTAGNITGNVAIVKNGSNTQTFAGPANTYTGNVTVNSGTLVAGGGANSNALGSPTTAGRVVTVNSGATISFTTNNVFGNGMNNNNLPSTVLNGGTLTSNRYNVLGNVTLNGGTLTQASTDSGNFEGYQIRGDVIVGGASGSTIASPNGKANHLGANTTFNVANATGDSNADLTVSAPLRNQSGDFQSAAGGLTKMGEGTLLLTANNTYTGPTVLAEGSLVVTGSIGGSTTTVSGGILSGTGTLGDVLINPLGTLSPGLSPGTLTAADVAFAGGTLALELNGTGAGQADQLIASGSVSLTSNTPLSISLAVGYDPVDDVDSFVVVSKTSVGAISTAGGLFTVGGTPLGEGAVFVVSGQQFAISYQGGDGNDVVVAAVPEPGSIAGLVAGCGVLLGLRRPRRRAA